MLNISSYIDHTLLKPTTTSADIKKLCEEAIQYHFVAVCIPPCWVKQASDFLSGSGVKVATVVGFPLGYEVLKAKLIETEQAMLEGAQELDAVINISALKSGSWSYLQKEMESIQQSEPRFWGKSVKEPGVRELLDRLVRKAEVEEKKKETKSSERK